MDELSLLDSIFPNDTYRIYVNGSSLGRRVTSLKFYNIDGKKVADAISSSPTTKFLRDNISLISDAGRKIIEIDFTGTYGFLPKLSSSIKDENGVEYASIYFQYSTFPYITVNGIITLKSEMIGRFARMSDGIIMINENSDQLATLIINSTGIASFDGYNLKINDRNYLKFALPIAIVYLRDHGLISSERD